MPAWATRICVAHGPRPLGKVHESGMNAGALQAKTG